MAGQRECFKLKTSSSETGLPSCLVDSCVGCCSACRLALPCLRAKPLSLSMAVMLHGEEAASANADVCNLQ